MIVGELPAKAIGNHLELVHEKRRFVRGLALHMDPKFHLHILFAERKHQLFHVFKGGGERSGAFGKRRIGTMISGISTSRTDTF